jgi:hypothetical protein
MRAPLDVVLVDSSGTAPESHISQRCSDVALGSSSPGGFASVTLSFNESLLSDFLLQYDTVYVYDERYGRQVGAGRLVEPAKAVSDQGEVWQLQAIGEGPAHMQDVTVPRVYIDSQLDGWYVSTKSSPSTQSTVGPYPGGAGADSILLSVPGGTVASGVMATMHHDRLNDCGMTLGGYGYTRIAGQASAGWQNESAVAGVSGVPALATLASNNWAVGSVATGPFVVNTDFTAGADFVRFAIRRSGVALTVVDDTSWGAFFNVYVAARRKLKDGTNEANANHANAYVLASEIVADLLGRDLPRFDGANATITATTHHIDQLAYIDGATPMQIMEDLLALESAYTWHVWDANPTTGLYSFEWVAWPSTVRYEASVIDGFSSPAPADDLYNEVNVRYRDGKGRTRWAQRTQTVAAFGTLTRAAMIDLGDETGSPMDAARVGDRFLADHAAPPNAGTLTVAQPIMDTVLGRIVYPWEIRPGNLIRVRGVRPYVDSLNATDRDGVTVFRIVSTSYSDSQGAAVLELDAYTPDEARQIARLTNTRRRRR